MLQITGNGANTSARNDPGFGKVGEARSGVVNVTGFPMARRCTPASPTPTR